MGDLNRREFLRIMGLAGTTTALGCSPESSRTLFPFVSAPEDIVPGKASWYATTCRECPAGCGLLAKNRDGRIIKVEGNPLHPVNAGKLCPRGQASLHGLYNPDRFPGPRIRNTAGRFEAVSWEKAEEILADKIREVSRKGRQARIAFLTGLTTGAMNDLVNLWLAEMGQPQGHIIYEPFSYEGLRKANQVVFGIDGIPSYRIDLCDFLVSFNAGFLETWLSNVEYARQFASFRALAEDGKNPFVFVGPRLSMTAANADLWIPVAPGDEYLVALGMLRVILDDNLPSSLGRNERAELQSRLRRWHLGEISRKSGVDQGLIRSVAHRFAAAEKPLALAHGLPVAGPRAFETALASNILCGIQSGTGAAIDFSSPSSYGNAGKAEDLKALCRTMREGGLDLLLIHDANPVFSLPASWEVRKCIESVPMVVSFSSTMDETSTLAHLVLPAHTPLESWGDYSPRRGITGLMQPAMGPVFNTRHPGDILISSGKKLKGEARFPWKDFYELLRISFAANLRKSVEETEASWQEALRNGGVWGAPRADTHRLSPQISKIDFPHPDNGDISDPGLLLTAYPTVQFFDGRGADRPWLQELPDPVTQVTWGGWVEIHPDTASELRIRKGDLLHVTSRYGSIDAPALPVPSVPAGTLAVPIGQGHTSFGRFADGLPANPLDLFPPDVDSHSGGLAHPTLRVTIEKKDLNLLIANTDGSFYQHGRELIQTLSVADFRQALSSGLRPNIDVPLPEGFDPEKDFYPPHEHKDYRWCMVVDLDRCIGCGACVVACYAENNVAVVGKEQVIRGREMSWLRVQRYFQEGAPAAAWLPMLCQHCECAPCESVCPVYAPHHSKEGLNNQVYNRCFGTRFCSQNDPYKVRRFNWFTFTRPAPLDMQLNPDVLVRQKGVMEKCSFCVQRIIEAKIDARNKGRKVRDGDFTTACAQTCPADVFTFGNLLDPESRVSRLVGDPRAYQVLGHLNTKPAVIYLKRATPEPMTV